MKIKSILEMLLAVLRIVAVACKKDSQTIPQMTKPSQNTTKLVTAERGSYNFSRYKTTKYIFILCKNKFIRIMPLGVSYLLKKEILGGM